MKQWANTHLLIKNKITIIVSFYLSRCKPVIINVFNCFCFLMLWAVWLLCGGYWVLAPGLLECKGTCYNAGPQVKYHLQEKVKYLYQSNSSLAYTVTSWCTTTCKFQCRKPIHHCVFFIVKYSLVMRKIHEAFITNQEICVALHNDVVIQLTRWFCYWDSWNSLGTWNAQWYSVF